MHKFIIRRFIALLLIPALLIESTLAQALLMPDKYRLSVQAFNERNLFVTEAVVQPQLEQRDSFDVSDTASVDRLVSTSMYQLEDPFKKIFGITQAELETDMAQPYSKKYRVEKPIIVPLADAQFEITALAYHLRGTGVAAAYLTLSSRSDGSVDYVTSSSDEDDIRWPGKLESIVHDLVAQDRLRSKFPRFRENKFVAARNHALAALAASKAAAVKPAAPTKDEELPSIELVTRPQLLLLPASNEVAEFERHPTSTLIRGTSFHARLLIAVFQYLAKTTQPQMPIMIAVNVLGVTASEIQTIVRQLVQAGIADVVMAGSIEWFSLNDNIHPELANILATLSRLSPDASIPTIWQVITVRAA